MYIPVVLMTLITRIHVYMYMYVYFAIEILYTCT